MVDQEGGQRYRRWKRPEAIGVAIATLDGPNRLRNLTARGVLDALMALPADTRTSQKTLAAMYDQTPVRVIKSAMDCLVAERFVVRVRYPVSRGHWLTDVLHADTRMTGDDLEDIAMDYGPRAIVTSWRGDELVDEHRQLAPHVPRRDRPVTSVTGPDTTVTPVDNPDSRRSHRPVKSAQSVRPGQTHVSAGRAEVPEMRTRPDLGKQGGLPRSHREDGYRPLGERAAISLSERAPVGGALSPDQPAPAGNAAPDGRTDESPSNARHAEAIVGALDLAKLGPTRGQHRQLVERVEAILAAGIAPAAVAAHVTTKLNQARTVKFLMGGLSEDHLPWQLDAPAAGRPAPAAWCGQCDERTRLLEPDAGPLVRCPTCHPLRGDRLPQARDLGRFPAQIAP